MKNLLLSLFVIATVSLSAQTMEERFRAFQQSSEQKYKNFRSQANQRYATFLQSSWETFQAGEIVNAPKEKSLPPIRYEQKKTEETIVEKPLPQETVVPTPAPTPKPTPIEPIAEPEVTTIPMTISLYGTDFQIRKPQLCRFGLKSLARKEMSEQWNRLSDYDVTLYDCLNAKSQYQLCDWAYIQLIKATAEKIYGQSNNATMLQAYLLSQSGYAMRLAQSGEKLFVLVGSKYKLYGQSHFDMDGLYFYSLGVKLESISICPGSFEKEQPMSIAIQQDQQLASALKPSPQRKSKMGIDATCDINTNTIDFYNSYPSGQIGGDNGTRWATYANAPLEETVRATLYPTLSAAIKGYTEKDAVGKILNWIQTAFEYENDNKVWGQDRAFFPSETLYYPYADCEDRAILFSRIVRDLIGLDVALLYYPGHLAAAVRFTEDTKGDYVTLNSNKYIVCDPTFIGAPVGMTMPGMNNQKAKVIALNR